jgi:hypothetical protein
METQSMSWHCDSEHGLGPVVAGLSMGAPAVMNFREKKESKKKTLKIQEASVECSHEVSLNPDAELIKEGVVASIVLQHVSFLFCSSCLDDLYHSAGRYTRHGRKRCARSL